MHKAQCVLTLRGYIKQWSIGGVRMTCTYCRGTELFTRAEYDQMFVK